MSRAAGDHCRASQHFQSSSGGYRSAGGQLFQPPLLPSLDRTSCLEACCQTGRAGSASLALHFNHTGKCCSRPIRRSLAGAPSAGQDRYSATGAFLR